MRYLLLLLSLLITNVHAQIVIPEGTPVLLVTQDRMVSGEVEVGSKVRLLVERDVLSPTGQILIAKGAPASGTVLKSEGSGFFGRSGALDFSLDNATAVDGTSVRLRAVRAATANDQETAVIVGGVLLSWAFIFMEGDDIDIPAGTVLNTWTAENTKLSKAGGNAKLVPASVKITTPQPGTNYKEEEKLYFAVDATPADPEAWVRVYIDDQMVSSQKGNLSRIEWNTYRNEKLTERVTGPGEHKLTIELTWANGQTAISAPVGVSFKDGPW